MNESAAESSEEGMLVVISGPSGVGKSTVCNEMIKRSDFRRVVTCTTRPPRKGETPGEDYHFLTREAFEAGIQDGGFLEHARVHDNYYGTPRAHVEQSLSNGEHLLLAIDVQGAEQIREDFRKADQTAGESRRKAASRGKLITIFLMPPDETVLSSRLRGRGTETTEQVEKRLATARQEITKKEAYDRIVVNDSLEDTVEEILALLCEA